MWASPWLTARGGMASKHSKADPIYHPGTQFVFTNQTATDLEIMWMHPRLNWRLDGNKFRVLGRFSIWFSRFNWPSRRPYLPQRERQRRDPTHLRGWSPTRFPRMSWSSRAMEWNGMRICASSNPDQPRGKSPLYFQIMHSMCDNKQNTLRIAFHRVLK